MSYITSSLSEYRWNTWEECMEILSDDCDWVCRSIKDRGFLFLIAFITLMSMSLLKVIVHIITQMQKPKVTYNHLDLIHGQIFKDSITDNLTRRESIEEVQNHDNYCPQDKVKNKKTETINKLRTYLYQHDLTLHGTILKKIEHRCTQGELAEMYRLGEFTKPLCTTHITFGEDINNLLKEVLKDTINLRINKLTKVTYIKVLNDEYIPIKEELHNIYNENIRIILD